MFNRSDLFFLGAAFASFVASVVLWFAVDTESGSFVGALVGLKSLLGCGVGAGSGPSDHALSS